jgi:uncharacterized membrane protein YkvA (DUF1232 family)
VNKRRVVGAVLLGAAAIVYGVSPIDLIPDLLGPLGIADDATVLVGAGLGVWRMLSKARKPKPTDPAN